MLRTIVKLSRNISKIHSFLASLSLPPTFERKVSSFLFPRFAKRPTSSHRKAYFATGFCPPSRRKRTTLFRLGAAGFRRAAGFPRRVPINLHKIQSTRPAGRVSLHFCRAKGLNESSLRAWRIIRRWKNWACCKASPRLSLLSLAQFFPPPCREIPRRNC